MLTPDSFQKLFQRTVLHIALQVNFLYSGLFTTNYVNNAIDLLITTVHKLFVSFQLIRFDDPLHKRHKKPKYFIFYIASHWYSNITFAIGHL